MLEKRTLSLVTFPNEILKTKCREVNGGEFGSVLNNYKKQMLDIMRSAPGNGVGIAANQVGLDIRCFLVGSDFIVNPVVATSGDVVDSKEGCLSIPGFEAIIPRYTEATVTGLDAYGNPVKKYYTGFKAFVAQHEVDHLNGKLINDSSGS